MTFPDPEPPRTHATPEGEDCDGDPLMDTPRSDAYPQGLQRCTDCGALIDPRGEGTVIAYGTPYTED